MAAKFLTTGGKHTFSGFNEQVTIRANPSLDKKSMDFGPEKKKLKKQCYQYTVGLNEVYILSGPSMKHGRTDGSQSSWY